jgi:hypothetical protein
MLSSWLRDGLFAPSTSQPVINPWQPSWMRIAAYESAYGGERTMPLLKYFVIIGVLLTALLLLADFMLEPTKAEISRLISARGETDLPKPKIRSRVGQQAMGSAETTPALEAQRRTTRASQARHEAVASGANHAGLRATERPVNEDRLESVKRAKPKHKTAKIPTRRQDTDVAWRHPHSRPGYNAYAQERPGWPFFAQGRPASPFFVPERPARPFFAQGTRGSNR